MALEIDLDELEAKSHEDIVTILSSPAQALAVARHPNITGTLVRDVCRAAHQLIAPSDKWDPWREVLGGLFENQSLPLCLLEEPTLFSSLPLTVIHTILRCSPVPIEDSVLRSILFGRQVSQHSVWALVGLYWSCGPEVYRVCTESYERAPRWHLTNIGLAQAARFLAGMEPNCELGSPRWRSKLGEKNG